MMAFIWEYWLKRAGFFDLTGDEINALVSTPKRIKLQNDDKFKSMFTRKHRFSGVS
jgi:hypothetical protein